MQMVIELHAPFDLFRPRSRAMDSVCRASCATAVHMPVPASWCLLGPRFDVLLQQHYRVAVCGKHLAGAPTAVCHSTRSLPYISLLVIVH
jgi:hypothetical protein